MQRQGMCYPCSGQEVVGFSVGDSGWLACRGGEGNGNSLQHSCLENPMNGGAWWAAVHGVSKSQTWLSDFTFTFHFCALEKEMATHSSVLAWRIPGTGELSGVPSVGSHRVGHDWSDSEAAVEACRGEECGMSLSPSVFTYAVMCCCLTSWPMKAFPAKQSSHRGAQPNFEFSRV